MRVSALMMAAFGLTAAATTAPMAQTIPPKSLYQAMLQANASSGWVQFRNFNGQQLVYFTALQTLHCRLSEIRYSINSDALDQRVDLVKCNPALPFSVGEGDVLEGRIYKSLPLGTAEWAAVQVVWDDGEESVVQKVRPCPNVGESTCGLVE